MLTTTPPLRQAVAAKALAAGSHAFPVLLIEGANEPAEARHIVETLAFGVDPATGEVLPDGHPMHGPRVIRAVYLAAHALDAAEIGEARPKTDKPRPAKSGQPWSSAEDEQLVAAFDSGMPVRELALKHERSRGAINSRLLRLGRLNLPPARTAGG